mgnify:CR=1 FL=1
MIGKDKVEAVPNFDCGDYVIVINADDIKLTREKETKKMYYRHSGFPGGLKEQTLEQVIAKNPAKAIEDAVYGMLPKNKLRPDMMQRLRVYPGAEHKQNAQTPKKLEVK